MARKSSAGSGFPIFIGVVIAIVSLTQDNYQGAAFAIGFGAILSLVMYVRGRRAG
ncbi:hypothetical protein EV385_3154 [Krasilnikovia cinnamomea]|uniref:Uncharacterized protein n=1 Tax=Krasilnikovia cinnamomea TaxID=349313 RepID=A0A4Q7ZM57_9ACTN|nr:hypothetical protein [Krasilnikovia cinnamomea]RZU51339.1 hypothetical protein EV385_3154 [Krasilnikovia cinnamomea]